MRKLLKRIQAISRHMLRVTNTYTVWPRIPSVLEPFRVMSRHNRGPSITSWIHLTAKAIRIPNTHTHATTTTHRNVGQCLCWASCTDQLCGARRRPRVCPNAIHRAIPSTCRRSFLPHHGMPRLLIDRIVAPLFPTAIHAVIRARNPVDSVRVAPSVMRVIVRHSLLGRLVAYSLPTQFLLIHLLHELCGLLYQTGIFDWALVIYSEHLMILILFPRLALRLGHKQELHHFTEVRIPALILLH